MKMAIVMRHDLYMRRGKAVAQGGHAAMAGMVKFLLHCVDVSHADINPISREAGMRYFRWIGQGMTKVCVRVESEQELKDIYGTAKSAGLECHMVVDQGITEFQSKPTLTCCAIGPDEDEKIDAITGELKLL